MHTSAARLSCAVTHCAHCMWCTGTIAALNIPFTPPADACAASFVISTHVPVSDGSAFGGGGTKASIAADAGPMRVVIGGPRGGAKMAAAISFYNVIKIKSDRSAE